MSTYTTTELIPFLQWGQPNDNGYAGGDTFVGPAVPAANYYGGQGAIQTVLFNVDNFVGNITIQATLNDLQESAPWFEIANLVAASPVGQVTSTTVIGNFTWLRATVTDFSAGNVNTVTASY
jgi:hypothetical protein